MHNIGRFAFLLLLVLLMACGDRTARVVYVEVKDQETEQGVDSVFLLLTRELGGENSRVNAIDTTYSNAEGKASFGFSMEPGYLFRIEASKRFYQEAIAPEGGVFLNQVELNDQDTQRYTLWLEPILMPDPERFEKMHTEVSIQDVLLTLKSDSWDWAFLPRMQWGDIPTLLSVSGDTAYVHQYPHHPRTTYQPDSVRVGLVALWLVEAIRKQQTKKYDFAHLMHPSRAPVLGTRRGNPSGFNSLLQIQTAAEAYQSWWEKAVESGDTIKSARVNPLRGKGMSWM